MSTETHNVGWITIWRVFLAIALVMGAFVARDAIVILLFAIIISSALDAPVDLLSSKLKMPRIMATIIIFTIGILVIVLVSSLILPIAIFELSSLIGQLTEADTGILLQGLTPITDIFTKDFSFENIGQITNIIFSGTISVVQTISSILGGMVFAILILIISFYLTLSQDGVGEFLRAVLPETLEDAVLRTYYRSKQKISKWFQAQILLSITVGMLVWAGLWLLGVQYAFAIGLLSAAFQIMPNVGPLFSGAIGTLIALSSSVSLGLYTLILFIVIQQLENHLFTPLFMKKAVNIHPVVTMFAIMVGFQLLGIIGMIMAVPAAVVLQDVIEERAQNKQHARARRGEHALE